MLSQGRIVTVAINNITFIRPVKVGDLVSCYVKKIRQGRTSINVEIEVWTENFHDAVNHKVAYGEFVYVAIDDKGQPRPIL